MYAMPDGSCAVMHNSSVLLWIDETRNVWMWAFCACAQAYMTARMRNDALSAAPSVRVHYWLLRDAPCAGSTEAVNYSLDQSLGIQIDSTFALLNIESLRTVVCGAETKESFGSIPPTNDPYGLELQMRVEVEFCGGQERGCKAAYSSTARGLNTGRELCLSNQTLK
jgi:hypothetical protein